MQRFGPFLRVTYLASAFQHEISTQWDIIILKLLPLYATVIKAKKKKTTLVGRRKEKMLQEKLGEQTGG